MVQRSSILLILVLVSGIFGAGCPAEMLKIHLPPTGVESVNQEDLRRAYWAVEQASDPLAWWRKRVHQLDLVPADNPNCHLHKGDTQDLGVVYANPTPMQLSILASLAKALDKTPTNVSWEFCILDPRADSRSFSTKVLDITSMKSPPFVDVHFQKLAQQVQEILVQQLQVQTSR